MLSAVSMLGEYSSHADDCALPWESSGSGTSAHPEKGVEMSESELSGEENNARSPAKASSDGGWGDCLSKLRERNAREAEQLETSAEISEEHDRVLLTALLPGMPLATPAAETFPVRQVSPASASSSCTSNSMISTTASESSAHSFKSTISMTDTTRPPRPALLLGSSRLKAFSQVALKNVFGRSSKSPSLSFSPF